MKFMLGRRLPTVRPLNTRATCPCGSGRSYRNCCKGSARAANRSPPGTPTGHAQPGCYASALNDCSSAISKEHPLSAAVLRRLTVGGTVRIRDFAFQVPGDTKHLAPGSLAPAVLCERHNNALSDLDQAGGDFFVRMEAVVRAAVGARPLPSRELFNGNDLERWLLKHPGSMRLGPRNWQMPVIGMRPYVRWRLGR